MFNLNLETHNLDKIFEFYNPDYIIGSINYQIPIDRLVEQFSNVVDLFKDDYNFEMTHRLSLVSTSISKLIECVNYYEQEKRFVEAKMSSKLTRSEKYVLKASDAISQIIDDIYSLLKLNEYERAEKLYAEYFSNYDIVKTLSDDDTNQNRMARQAQYEEGFRSAFRQKCSEDSSFPLKMYHTLEDYMTTTVTARKFSRLALLLTDETKVTKLDINGTYGVDDSDWQTFTPDTDSLKQVILTLFYKKQN